MQWHVPKKNRNIYPKKVSKLRDRTTYLDQFWLRNLMVSFVLAYDPQKLQKSHLKNDVLKGYDFGYKNSIWGSKIELST